MNDSPPCAQHLMTLEAGPADWQLAEALDTDHEFVSRCICGHDIPWGPFEQTSDGIREHLVDVGLLAAGPGTTGGGDAA